MFRSMTAYVYRSVPISIGQLTIELQSLNRKHLDITTFLQKELARYETDVKKVISNQIHRGQLNVRISLKCHGFSTVKVSPNLPLAQQLKAAWEEIAHALGVSAPSFDLHLLKDEAGLLILEDSLGKDEGVKIEILSALEETLNELLSHKLEEGKTLLSDIEARANLLTTLIETISAKSGQTVERQRRKLIEKLEELLPGAAANDERILREVCLIAEKADIAEELTRFRSHLILLRKVMGSDEISQGKKLEFILQELSREANTIGSKSSDVEIAHLVVDIKSELEKIREQVQNIE